MGLNIGQVDPQTLQKILFGGPQSMFQAPPDGSQAPTPQADPSAQQQPGAIAQGMAAQSPQSQAPPQPTQPAQAPQPAQPSQPAQPTAPSPAKPMSSSDFAAANPDAAKAFMPTRPMGDFDKIPDGQPGADSWGNQHNTLRHVLASLFAGAAEFGGDLNHHPGAGARFSDRWMDQSDAQRQYDNPANQQKMKAGSLNQAYQNYLGQQQQGGDIQHTAAETTNLQQNVPMLQRQQAFIDKVRTLKESGKYSSDDDLFHAVLPEASTIPGMSRQGIVDAINSSKQLGSKYTLTRDPQTQAPIELVDRQGNHYSQSNLPKDPEAQQMWKDAQTASAGKEKVEENKEGRVATIAANAQARAFQQQELEQGRKAASSSLNDISDAKNQQKMIGDLLTPTGGKMNPTAQTAAMFKMIGLEQPTGAHRIMPAEIEGIEQQGGLTDRLKQKLLNWKEGDRFDPDLIPDVVSTAKTLSDNKIKTANDNLEHNATVYGYKVPNSDAKGRLDKPGDYQQSGGGNQQQHVPGGQATGLTEGATGTGTDGKKYVVKKGVWQAQ